MSYRVVTSWDGERWVIRVEDPHGFHHGDATAPSLSEVEPRARVLLPEGAEVAVEVQLHPEVEGRLRVAEDLCEDASKELDAVVVGLLSLDVPAADIVTLLASRRLHAWPHHPLPGSDAGRDDVERVR